MKIEEIVKVLNNSGQEVIERKRLPNDTGTQLKLNSGAVVNAFDKGTYNIQGKNKSDIEEILEQHQKSSSPKSLRQASNLVFVVYGHDTNTRTQLEAMLRRWGIEPLIIDQLPSEGQTIIEKLENHTATVNFAVVLATPDDEGHRTGHPDEKSFRSRQNVVLEMGMLLAKLGRSKVAVLIKEPQKMERPSDIQGIIYIPFTDNLEKEAGVLLAKEMEKQGFNIPVSKL